MVSFSGCRPSTIAVTISGSRQAYLATFIIRTRQHGGNKMQNITKNLKQPQSMATRPRCLTHNTQREEVLIYSSERQAVLPNARRNYARCANRVTKMHVNGAAIRQKQKRRSNTMANIVRQLDCQLNHFIQGVITRIQRRNSLIRNFHDITTRQS